MKEEKIISIEELEEGQTIDIQVTGDNLFFANNILTHNSQLQRSAMNLTIDELSEGNMGDSWRKIAISDSVVLAHNTPEERSMGKINFKTVKARNGIKDSIVPLRIVYPEMRVDELRKK